MKKRRRARLSLFDRFCAKFGPTIMKVCHFVDKHTHVFFEGLACILTGGAYQPRPYKEPEEVKTNSCSLPYTPKRSVSDAIESDLYSVMGDFRSVQRDIAKAVRRIEHENPTVGKAMQDVKNSPEFQAKVQEVQKRISDVQQRCNHIRYVCSHSTTVGSGNTSERERTE